jgi:hypothetical protein
MVTDLSGAAERALTTQSGVCELDEFYTYWVCAFLTLSTSLLLLFCYFRLVGSDLGLNGFIRELVLALGVSACEAGLMRLLSWVIGYHYEHNMIGPGLIVILIYKLAHLADWDNFEAPVLFGLQMTVWLSSGAIYAGEFQVAFVILVGCAMCLSVMGGFAKTG